MDRHKQLKKNIFLLSLVSLIGFQFLHQAQAAYKGDAKAGSVVFKKANCAQCHPGGNNVIMPQSPIKGEKFTKEFPTDQSIAKVIRSGIVGTPMQAFNQKKISDKELVDLIAYIRSLSKTTK
jgi:mono/diheme cytochrome c family protein